MRRDSTTTTTNIRSSFIISPGQLQAPLCLLYPRQHTFKWLRQLYWLTSYSRNVAVTHSLSPRYRQQHPLKPCMLIQQHWFVASCEKGTWISLYASINFNKKFGELWRVCYTQQVDYVWQNRAVTLTLIISAVFTLNISQNRTSGEHLMWQVIGPIKYQPISFLTHLRSWCTVPLYDGDTQVWCTVPLYDGDTQVWWGKRLDLK
jgi:hypothetical protein